MAPLGVRDFGIPPLVGLHSHSTTLVCKTHLIPAVTVSYAYWLTPTVGCGYPIQGGIESEILQKTTLSFQTVVVACHIIVSHLSQDWGQVSMNSLMSSSSAQTFTTDRVRRKYQVCFSCSSASRDMSSDWEIQWWLWLWSPNICYGWRNCGKKVSPQNILCCCILRFICQGRLRGILPANSLFPPRHKLLPVEEDHLAAGCPSCQPLV